MFFEIRRKHIILGLANIAIFMTISQKNTLKSKSLITVVTVVFNGVEFLEKTIESVINQTYDNIEYIVIDGGSADGTVDIIKKYEDKITCWVSEPDKGIYDAMNKGIDLATGDWINFMNAGDVFFDNSTVKTLSTELDSNAIIMYGDTMNDYGAYEVLKKSLNLSGIIYGMIFCHQSVFVKTSYHKANKFSSNYSICGDHEFFLKAYIENSDSFKCIALPIARFLTTGLSGSNEIELVMQKINILKSLNLYTIKVRFTLYLSILKIITKRILPNYLVRKINTRVRE